jgi:hypothetical protein
MKRKVLVSVAIAGIAVFFVSAGWADVPAPPVNQTIGQPDVLTADMQEADCRVCHDANDGVPDRHHGLYNGAVPDPSLVPYPQFNTPDGSGGFLYSCMSCHNDDFILERNCLVCHNAGSPHHATPDAAALHCSECHGALVNDFDDGHYIPSYAPSLVTPWRGLNGDGYENATYPDTEDLASDGSGPVVPADFTETEAGPPFYTVTTIGALGETNTRNEPNKLKFKPAGDNNDVFIGSTHHGGEEYSVVFNSGSPLAAAWDAGTQTLSVTLDATQTAQEVVDTINFAADTDADTDGLPDDVEATLGYDGDDDVADLLADEHYEPMGGATTNDRGYGAGSCSYCHDTDGILDANGDPAGIIWDNHTLHHEVMDGSWGGYPARCNICHDYATVGEQSGPNFNSAIRVCEKCHGPDTLHNIQADSPNPANIGTVVTGGEDAGYGHIGRDAGPGDSDCWGCHGFPMGSTAAIAPGSGPVIPTVYTSDIKAIDAGTDTTVTLTGSSFTNVTGATAYVSDVALTAAGGSSVILTPDVIDERSLGVTIPGDTPAGNYELQAVKGEFTSNPAVISIKPRVIITETSADRETVTITGSGFGGYAAGSGTSVTAEVTTGRGRSRTTTTVEADIVSWSDTTIEAYFGSRPSEVTVNSVFGSAASEVSKPKKGKGKKGL